MTLTPLDAERRHLAERLHLVERRHLAERPTSDHPAKPWAADFLSDCARAFADKDSANLHRLLWMLNKLASPYGDCEQRLAYAFLQALFCRAIAFGDHCYNTSLAVAECSWPTLLEALTSRADADAPRARLTVVSSTTAGVVAEIGAHIEKFARLMGVPLEFRAIAAPVGARIEKFTRLMGVPLEFRAIAAPALHPEKFELREGEVVAVNCVGALRRAGCGDSRDSFLRAAAALRPRVLTVVEDKVDFGATGEFMESFEECLWFYDSYFDMLEESFPATCNERLALERECFRSLVGLLACEGGTDAVVDGEQRERGRQWCRRLERCGFKTFNISDDIIDDLKVLLKRYRPGWSLLLVEGETLGMYLTWKENPVVWACAWKPK
ncbi:hypothetical protein ZIOFF_038736 [Zingiber officinale]|uniref:Uncharacterized protein n=1 Tax=Zingiber officinale TaxID=94328 RepID=A0A8J5FZY1_ZINOF|nr:hypothetical protein ZIOFF_038736 [Zingiber officinale]